MKPRYNIPKLLHYQINFQINSGTIEDFNFLIFSSITINILIFENTSNFLNFSNFLNVLKRILSHFPLVFESEINKKISSAGKKDMTPTHYGAVYLAFLDVLGFKALVENNTHQKVVDLYSNVLDGFASKIPQIISKVEQKSYKVNSLMIQDSIILWIEAHHYLYLNVLIGAIQKLLLNGFLNGLAIRGAISYGEISVLSKEGEKYAIYSIIGKPIVDAYNAEENQDWIGCICADSLISTLEQFKLDLIVRDKYLIEYKIPRKDGLTKKGYAVRWHIDMIRQNTDAIVRECFAMHSRDIKKPDIENKIINTIKFIEEVDPIGQFLERIEY